MMMYPEYQSSVNSRVEIEDRSGGVSIREEGKLALGYTSSILLLLSNLIVREVIEQNL